jgi:hypothetical protein
MFEFETTSNFLSKLDKKVVTFITSSHYFKSTFSSNLTFNSPFQHVAKVNCNNIQVNNRYFIEKNSFDGHYEDVKSCVMTSKYDQIQLKQPLWEGILHPKSSLTTPNSIEQLKLHHDKVYKVKCIQLFSNCVLTTLFLSSNRYSSRLAIDFMLQLLNLPLANTCLAIWWW